MNLEICLHLELWISLLLFLNLKSLLMTIPQVRLLAVNVNPKSQFILIMLGHWHGMTLVSDSASKQIQLKSLSDLFLIQVTQILIWNGSDLDLSSLCENYTSLHFVLVSVCANLLTVCSLFLSWGQNSKFGSVQVSLSKATDKAENSKSVNSLHIFLGHLVCSRLFVRQPENRGWQSRPGLCSYRICRHT